MLPTTNQNKKRLLFAALALLARVMTHEANGYGWAPGPQLSTWLTWTIVIVAFAATHTFEEK
jgi:hypothetical protein